MAKSTSAHFDKYSAEYRTLLSAVGTAIACTEVPIGLVGIPGNGKTSFIDDVTEKYGWMHVKHLPSSAEPSDYGGTAFFREDDQFGRVQDKAPQLWALQLKKHLESGQRAAVSFDEITSARPATLAPLMEAVRTGNFAQVICDETKLARICMWNPPEIAAAGIDLPAPFANRMVIFNWELNATDWATGMTYDWPTPELPTLDEAYYAEVERQKGQYMTLAIGFMKRFPEDLNGLPESFVERGEAYSSPRSWENLVKLLAHAVAAKQPRSVMYLLAAGTVGKAVANRFLEYVESLDLPDPWELLDNPKKFKADTARTDRTAAIAQSVVAALASVSEADPTKVKRWNNVGLIMEAIYDAGLADVAFPSIRAWKSMPQGYANKSEYVISDSFTEKLYQILVDMGVVKKKVDK